MAAPLSSAFCGEPEETTLRMGRPKDYRPAGPVTANSPFVLAPPIPQWVPFAAGEWAPSSPRHPPGSRLNSMPEGSHEEAACCPQDLQEFQSASCRKPGLLKRGALCPWFMQWIICLLLIVIKQAFLPFKNRNLAEEIFHLLA
jgi:hypothetical protein